MRELAVKMLWALVGKPSAKPIIVTERGSPASSHLGLG